MNRKQWNLNYSRKKKGLVAILYNRQKTNSKKRKHEPPDYTLKTMKSVLQYNENKEFLKQYNSVSEAHEITGINIGNISQVCKGNRKTAGNFIWSFKGGDKTC